MQLYKTDETTGQMRPMTDAEQAAESVARRERLARSHADYMAEVKRQVPSWAEIAEDMTETIYSASACELLAETAPDDGYLRGYWLGRAAALHGIAAITGRTQD